MIRKKIGICGIKIDNTFGVHHTYINFLEQFDAEIVIIHPSQYLNPPQLNLLVLPGGPDINPTRYGNKPPLIYTSPPDPFLEYFDKIMLPIYIQRQTPIFAICRGMQTINVHFNGTLKQHIHKHDNTRHGVYNSVEGANYFEVNSYHHQSIDTLGDNLVAVLHANQDGVIEYMKHNNGLIHGVQWHPEREIRDRFSIDIINRLLM